MTEITVTLPVPPMMNSYWHHRVFKGRAITHLSHEGRKYKKTVAEIMDKTPIDGDVGVSVTVYRPRKAGDIDGYAKGLLDAMKGLAYVDDAQISTLCMYRRDDKTNPRCEVRVWSVTE